MQTPQRKLKDVERLLSAFHSSGSGDPEQVLRNFLFAVDEYPADDVQEGVNAFLRGKVPGFDGRFAPTAPQLASQCRRVMNERLGREERDKRYRQPLALPQVKVSDEARARVKAKIDAFISGQVAEQVHADEAKARKALFEETNARFYPDMSPDAVKDRLHLRHIGIGDADGDRDVARPPHFTKGHRGKWQTGSSSRQSRRASGRQ